MSRETKIGLVLILVLMGVFSVVVYKKINANSALLTNIRQSVGLESPTSESHDDMAHADPEKADSTEEPPPQRAEPGERFAHADGHRHDSHHHSSHSHKPFPGEPPGQSQLSVDQEDPFRQPGTNPSRQMTETQENQEFGGGVPPQNEFGQPRRTQSEFGQTDPRAADDFAAYGRGQSEPAPEFDAEADFSQQSGPRSRHDSSQHSHGRGGFEDDFASTFPSGPAKSTQPVQDEFGKPRTFANDQRSSFDSNSPSKFPSRHSSDDSARDPWGRSASSADAETDQFSPEVDPDHQQFGRPPQSSPTSKNTVVVEQRDPWRRDSDDMLQQADPEQANPQTDQFPSDQFNDFQDQNANAQNRSDDREDHFAQNKGFRGENSFGQSDQFGSESDPFSQPDVLNSDNADQFEEPVREDDSQRFGSSSDSGTWGSKSPSPHSHEHSHGNNHPPAFDRGHDHSHNHNHNHNHNHGDRFAEDDGFGGVPQPDDGADEVQDLFGKRSTFSNRHTSTGTSRPTSDDRSGSRYTIQPKDSYWSISKRHYGTARYFQALAEYNREQVPDPKLLRPGMTVMVPQRDVLEARYAKLLTQGAPPSNHVAGHAPSDNGPGYASTKFPTQAPTARFGFFHSDDGRPQYRVGTKDTLGEIARQHLGRASRWIQIYHLNRDSVTNPHDLKIGTVLRLPRDASGVNVVEKQARIR